jgi:hypothetical protein
VSIISPEFTFAEYWSFHIESDGGLGAPFPPDAKSLLRSSLDGKFIYAFGEVVGGTKPFELVELFFIRQPAGALFPSIHTVPQQSVAEVTEKEMSPALDVVTLPTTSSGGLQDRKYFFLAVPRLLEAATIAELEAERPSELPLVGLTPFSSHFRILRSTGNGLEYDGLARNGRRAMFVVEPYSAIRHIADVFEFRCDAAVRFVKPEAAETDAERRVVEERLLRHALALEIDALDKAGMSFTEELGSLVDMQELLRDMDPTAPGGRLTTLRRQREDAAMAIILFTSHGKLWNLLERDARTTDDRAKKHYGAHLDATCYAHRRLPESAAGLDFWREQSLKFGMLESREPRGTATNAMEFTAQHFVFAEHLEPEPKWKEPLPSEAARNLLAVHTQMASVLATHVKDSVAELTGVLKPDANFEAWASGPLRSQMGLLAYRWAYHLRSAFALDRMTLGGKEVIVAWNGTPGRQQQATVLDLSFNFDQGEFSAKFPIGPDFLGHAARAMSVIGAFFSIASLDEAVRKRKDTLVPALKSGAAFLSLVSDLFFIQKLEKIDNVALAARGAKALKLAGVAGAIVGTAASGVEAIQAFENDGDGDLVLAHGVNVVGGALATWGAVGIALGSTGPMGWIALGGLTLSLLAPLMIAYLTDTPVEDMVEHSVFGTKPGANDKAPGVAVCVGGRFSSWANPDIAVLQEQIRAFRNATWTFALAGAGRVGPYPVLRFFPQRLMPGSGFLVQVRIRWTASGITPELEQGAVFLHVGDKTALRVEAVSGVSFGGPPLSNGRALLTRDHVDDRLFFDWIIAPDNMGQREFLEKNNGRPSEALVTVSLSAHGKDDRTLVVPLTAKGDPPRVFNYELVRSGREAAPINSEEKLSASVYG